MMMALAAQRRSAVRAGARRRDAAAGRGRGRRHACRRSAPGSRTARSTLEAGRRARLPRVRVARRRLPVSRNRRDLAGRRRGARPVARPLGARAFRPADLARHGAPLGARADATRSARHHDARHSDRRRRFATRWSCTPRSADRRICCCTCRRSPTPPACDGRPSQDWARVNRQVPRLVDALPNGPRHHPTVQVFLAGGVPEVMLHLRALGLLDTRVLTVERQHARRAARCVGIVRSAAHARATAARTATASIPTT